MKKGHFIEAIQFKKHRSVLKISRSGISESYFNIFLCILLIGVKFRYNGTNPAVTKSNCQPGPGDVTEVQVCGSAGRTGANTEGIMNSSH